MRARSYLLLSVYAALLVSGFVYAQDSAPAKPHAVVDTATFDFGNVIAGAVVKHSFIVRNTGAADLTISGVIPACGCTVANVNGRVVAAGQSTTVDVELNTAGFIGAQSKELRLKTTDPDNSAILLKLIGNIEPLFSVEPQALLFGTLTRDHLKQGISKQFKIKAHPLKAGKIIAAKSYSRYLTVSDAGNDNGVNSQGAIFTVSLGQDLPLGFFRERVLVQTTLAEEQYLNIAVTATIVGNVTAKPVVLSYGIVEGSAAITKKIKIVASNGSKIRSLQAKSDTAALTVAPATHILERDPLKSVDLAVSLNPQKMAEELHSFLEINVTLDDNRQETLTVSVYGIKPPKR